MPFTSPFALFYKGKVTTTQLSYCILIFFSIFFVTICNKTVTKKVQLFRGANQFVIFCYVRKHLITRDFLSNSCKLCGKSIPEKTLDSPSESVLEKAVLCTSSISKSAYCLFFKREMGKFLKKGGNGFTPFCYCTQD